jgi:hypothetical protein
VAEPCHSEGLLANIAGSPAVVLTPRAGSVAPVDRPPRVLFGRSAGTVVAPRPAWQSAIGHVFFLESVVPDDAMRD